MTIRKKYPKTSYLPWSDSLPETGSSEDRILSSDETDALLNGRIVFTEKMDGENVTVYADGWHTRSLDSVKRLDQDLMSSIASRFMYALPTHYRVHGEYLYAKHSIHYNRLESYFQVFAISDILSGMVLSWEKTVDLVDSIHFGTGAPICTVPVLSMPDVVDKTKSSWIIKLAASITALNDLIKITNINGYEFDKKEGYVIRNADEFPFSELSKNVAKFVRANHVKTDDHWRNQPLVQNQLEERKR